MTTPVHMLHVFQKPRAGSAFLRSYPALHYRHRILANGGFDTASCSIPVGRAEGETIFENMVGNRVAVVVDNPFEPAFDGYISRVTFTLPGIVLTRSLDETGNRIVISVAGGAGGNTTTGSTVNNTASQAIYGIKAKTERAARQYAAATYQPSLSARALNDLAYPISSVASNTGNVNTMIEIELKGFYHTLDWENSDAFTGTKQCRNGTTGWFDVFLASHPNTTTFISSSAAELTNNLQTYPGVADGGTIWKKMQMLAECGDNAQRWICGVSPYDWNISSRRLYYRPASTTVKYLAKVNQPGRLFSPQGALVQPWTVKPDGIIRIIDALVGWDGDGFDPREVYIAALEYDADTGQVAWQSDDNIAMQGALQTDKWHTSSDQLYGQRASNPLM